MLSTDGPTIALPDAGNLPQGNFTGAVDRVFVMCQRCRKRSHNPQPPNAPWICDDPGCMQWAAASGLHGWTAQGLMGDGGQATPATPMQPPSTAGGCMQALAGPRTPLAHLLTPSPEALAGYLEHMRRCMQDPVALRAQAQKHFQIYVQDQKTCGMQEIMLSWSRLHLRLGLAYNQASLALLGELANKHLGDTSTARLNQDSFELFYVKMLMTIRPPLLVGGALGPEGSPQESYRRRLQRCLLDPDQLHVQAGKHFRVFGRDGTMGLAEVTQSMFQMHVRIGLPHTLQQLENMAKELLRTHASGFDAPLVWKDAWELFYWKMLLVTFRDHLPLEAPENAGAEDTTTTKEPAEEPVPGPVALGSVPNGGGNPAAAKFLCAAAAAQMNPNMVGVMQPMMPVAMPMSALSATAVAPHGVVWPVMQAVPRMAVPSAPAAPAVQASMRAQAMLPTSLDSGRFIVERRLGTGSFGEVFKAKVAATGKLVAVKRVLKQRETIMKEFMVLRKLKHPNVLQVTEHFEDEQSLYVVSEFLSGGSVTDLLHSECTPLSEAWVAEVTRQTLAAMAYCHSEGVVHNDLKPENLLLKSSSITSTPYAVVSDFGQASAALEPGQCPTTELPLGDPRYVPPEAWDVQTCHGVCSKPGDIWMIACTLFEMLSGGARPFLARKNVSLKEFKNWCATVQGFAIKWAQCLKSGNLMWRNLCDPPRSQSAISCIGLMLAKNPAHRPDCNQAADHVWFWEQRCHPPQPGGISVEAQAADRGGCWQGQQQGACGDRGVPQLPDVAVLQAQSSLPRLLPQPPAKTPSASAPPAPPPGKVDTTAPAGFKAPSSYVAAGSTAGGAPQPKKGKARAAQSPQQAPPPCAVSHADELMASLELERRHTRQGCSLGGAQAQESSKPTGAAADGGQHPQGCPLGRTGMPASPAWLPVGTWQRYREPGTARLWFYREETGDFFFADHSHPWRQLTSMDGRIWWWSQESNESFFEDDCGCDPAPEKEEDRGADAGASVALVALGLKHLIQGVTLSGLVRPTECTEQAAVSVRYTGRTWEFQVVLDRTTKEDKFGIAFRVDVDTRTPVVSQVKAAGICAQHNSEMRQFPEDSPVHQMQVVPGDKVKVVNGFTSVEKMKNELTNALVVHLRMVRPANPPVDVLAAGVQGAVTARMLLQ